MTDPSPFRLGRVAIEGDSASVTFERWFPDPPESLWKAITDPDELATWYMERTKIDGRVGGRVEFWSGDSHATGTILVWEPPRVFEHEWNVELGQGSHADKHGVIRWELLREGDTTLLRLTHKGLTRQNVHWFAPGEHAILDRLEAHLRNTSMPDWYARSAELRESYSRQPS